MAKRSQVEVSGNTDCLHCVVMRALVSFTHERRGGHTTPIELLEALELAWADIYASAPDDDSRRIAEERMVNHFSEYGIHLMRVQGTA